MGDDIFLFRGGFLLTRSNGSDAGWTQFAVKSLRAIIEKYVKLLLQAFHTVFIACFIIF